MAKGRHARARCAPSAEAKEAAKEAAKEIAAAEAEDNDGALHVLVQRGITPRQRHLVRDLGLLLPRARFGGKMPRSTSLEALQDACFASEGGMRALFIPATFEDEMRLWLVRLPHGPSVQFQVLNVHTNAECNFEHTLRRVRQPCLVSFDALFDETPHLRLIRELLRSAFSTSPGCAPSAPPGQEGGHLVECGFQTVVSFHYRDERVWMRAYDVVLGEDGTGCEELHERGPRLVLTPQRILASVLDGAPLWEGAGLRR
ncbi:Brix domain-containing protein [Pavlovales sp. CCMP2436]|nr:Brix domain-containing protein [Pavlovales sp. CCMP2436]